MVDTRLDMLVRLYALPPAPPVPEDVAIRPPVAYERRAVERWVDATFGDLWAGEAATALSQVPASLVIAVRDRTILGFACFDVTARGFIGPVGVDERARGRGLGVALTHAALEGLRRRGFAYAVIGDVGPVGFYVRHFGAIPIPDSAGRPVVAVRSDG